MIAFLVAIAWWGMLAAALLIALLVATALTFEARDRWCR